MEHHGLFDSIMDSAVLLDKAGRVINWNLGAASLFGYSKKEVLSKSINFIYDRNYPFPKLIQELNTQQKKWQEDTIFIRKNGIKGNCKSYLCPLPLTEQNKITALLIHQNVSTFKKSEEEFRHAQQYLTEKIKYLSDGFWSANSLLIESLNHVEQMERKLRESELRFHLLAENATDIISRHTPNGEYLYISPACKSSMGYKPEDLIGKNIYRLIHNDDQFKISKTLSQHALNSLFKKFFAVKYW